MESLLRRLQEATGPDRALDAEINLAVFSQVALPEPPAYTASLDAAMTLIPTGYIAREMNMRDGTLRHFPNSAIVVPENANDVAWTKPKGVGVSPANLAIALSIACLRARGIGEE